MGGLCGRRPCPERECPVQMHVPRGLPSGCGLPHLLYNGRIEETSDALLDTPDSSRTAYVYWMYDKFGGLLYIGNTFSPGNRYAQHQQHSLSWIPLANAWVVFAVMGSSRERAKVSAEHWEQVAINRELPGFNLIGSPLLPARNKVVTLDLVQSG